MLGFGAAWVIRARLLAALGVVAAGLVTLLGSGGGSWTSHDDPCPRAPGVVALDPAYAVVAVGTAVRFTALPDFGAATFRWRRCAGGRCADLVGVTGDTYVLEGASLADDGAQISVTADGCWWAATGSTTLEVRAAPGAVYRDLEFETADWEATPLRDDGGGSRWVVTRSTADGNPGAFASIAYEVDGPAGALRVFHGARQATYDPVLEGALDAIDFAADCRTLRADNGRPDLPRVALQQAGRWYEGVLHVPQRDCPWQAWQPAFERTSYRRLDFQLVLGPACGPTEACPDFSAGGAPIRFGFIGGAVSLLHPVAASTAFGIDNWQVTVWRK